MHSFGIIEVFEPSIKLHEVTTLWEIGYEVHKQKLIESRNLLFWPCDLTWASTVKDNKCGSPHHQSWDRKNQRPSRFYAFVDHPFLYPSPQMASGKKKSEIKYNKNERMR